MRKKCKHSKFPDIQSNKDIRGVFIIDPNNTVRSVNFYPMEVGRNMNEIVRLVEALQTVDQAKVLTPANWENGQDVMVPYYPYTKEQLADFFFEKTIFTCNVSS